mmetsp:Transcript_626/g.2322  ORF Transcript_626/g.2322 Transcript_626/m.2322 type:complete len:227 (+) Transcript_626:2069-2749(+)
MPRRHPEAFLSVVLGLRPQLADHNNTDEPLVLGRQLQGKLRERIEHDAIVRTMRTLDRGLELACKEVNHDAIISLLVRLQRLLGDLPIRASPVLRSFGVWPISHSVQVLVQAIEQVGHQLLSVLLREAHKLWCESGHSRLESPWNDARVAAEPHPLGEAFVLLRQDPSRAKEVLLVQILLEAIIQEVAGERPAMQQGLNGRGHEAGVPQVVEADLAPAHRLNIHPV